MIVHVDVEFLIRGQDAAELVNAALSRLEQLNGGPLPAGTAPAISGVKPDSLDGAGVVQMWAGVVTASVRRDVAYADGGGEDLLAVSERRGFTTTNHDDGLPTSDDFARR